MNDEASIIAAMQAGEIKKIVMIDDAFDPPGLGNEDAGPLLDFLEKEENATTLRRAKVTAEEIEAAKTAINDTDYTDEALNSVVSKLYGQYVDKFNDRFDPSGRFSILKGDNLRRIRPLLRLLSKCKDITITRIGTNADDVDLAKLKPDAIFIDYYLNGDLSALGPADPVKEGAARQDSLGMLRRVLNDSKATSPSIMLMSSHAVRKEADKFRREVNDGRQRLFASRFQYLAKDDLDEEENGVISLKRIAADALLDIAHCHKFAGAVEEALTHWRTGAEGAVQKVWDTVTNLELKDYAYLARFRLAEEGQPLSSYLEWFLGEVLVDQIARSVKWNDDSFSVLNAATTSDKPGSQIEGTFDGATDRIADLYFRARIDARTGRQGTELRTGDLYMKADRPNEILAVITPECDLVSRQNKRKAVRMMTVAGTIQAINSADSSMADYILLNKKPSNVVWNAKDIRTLEYSDIGTGGYQLVGMLRPLYAYELQNRVLSDLGRVGLAVAPALGMAATVKVIVRNTEGVGVEMPLPNAATASCIVIPKRGSSDKARIVYHRSFAADLLSRLFSLPEKAVHDDAKAILKSLKDSRQQQKLHKKLCVDGQFDGEQTFQIVSSLQQENKGGDMSWCQILVAHNSTVEVADENGQAAGQDVLAGNEINAGVDEQAAPD